VEFLPMSTTTHRDEEKIRVVRGPREGEPRPVWKGAPRHVPQVDFPAYRHVPGQTPHPERHKEGHSYGLNASQVPALSPENWAKHRSYLLGIDLYHQGYLWEAHAAWELPWRAVDVDSIEANLLQALILNAAAQLKIHQGNAAGARRHSLAARWRLARVRAKGYEGPNSTFLGLDISDLNEQMKRHYGPLWESEDNDEIRLYGRAPRLKLAIEDLSR
jgi:hypothetical protein